MITKSRANGIMDWLLDPVQPAVRYRALIDILERPADNPEVRQTFREISEKGWAAQILKTQKPQGFWESRDDLYRPKYTATIWRLLVLADLGLTAKEERIRKPCEFFLKEYSREDGGLDMPDSNWTRSELCVTGNLARTLTLCGYEEDPRVRSAFKWLVENQMEDGGWHCFYEKAFGRGTLDCWEGLSAFAALPRSKWTRSMKRSVERGAEFFLERNLFREGSRRYVPWFRFHYPVHYYYDLLVGLDVLTRLGYSDDRRLEPALAILEEKRTVDGTWALDRVHADVGLGAGYRFRKNEYKPFALEEAGLPSKWITLQALRILKRVSEAMTS